MARASGVGGTALAHVLVAIFTTTAAAAESVSVGQHGKAAVPMQTSGDDDDAASATTYDDAGNLRGNFFDAGVAPAARQPGSHLRVMTFYGGTADELGGWTNVLRPAAGVADCANVTITETWGMKLFVHLPGIFDKHRRQNTTGHPGLHPDWINVTDDFIASVKPHVASGCVLGVFMGDEVCCGGVPYLDMSVVAARLKAGLPDALIYVNECTELQSWPKLECRGAGAGLRCTGGVPSGLDIISIDLYDRHNTNGREHTRQLRTAIGN